MKKVLSIGSKPYSKFGISQVTGVMSELQFEESEIQLEHLSSYDGNKNIFGKIIIFSLVWLKLLFVQKKFDVFHLHCSSGGSLIRNYLFLLILSWFNQEKRLIHIHGDILNRVKGKRFQEKISKKVFQLANHYVFLTEDAKINFSDHYDLNLEKCFVLPNPVPVERIQKELSISELNLRRDVKKIIYLGTVAEHKGINDFLVAANNILEKGYQCEFLIAGSGELLDELKSEYSSQKRIKFWGWAEGKQKWEVLLEGDVLVIPSRCEEAFGIVALEGMALGLSLIVSNRGGLKSIVEHERNGLMFEAGEVSQLESHLERLIEDYQLRARFFENNIEDVKKYDVEKFENTLAAIYGRIF